MLNLDTPEQIVDELSYRCYEDNRAQNPTVDYREWACVFGLAVERYEQRYQMELNARLRYYHEHPAPEVRA